MTKTTTIKAVKSIEKPALAVGGFLAEKEEVKSKQNA